MGMWRSQTSSLRGALYDRCYFSQKNNIIFLTKRFVLLHFWSELLYNFSDEVIL